MITSFVEELTLSSDWVRHPWSRICAFPLLSGFFPIQARRGWDEHEVESPSHQATACVLARRGQKRWCESDRVCVVWGGLPQSRPFEIRRAPRMIAGDMPGMPIRSAIGNRGPRKTAITGRCSNHGLSCCETRHARYDGKIGGRNVTSRDKWPDEQASGEPINGRGRVSSAVGSFSCWAAGTSPSFFVPSYFAHAILPRACMASERQGKSDCCEEAAGKGSSTPACRRRVASSAAVASNRQLHL